MDNSSLYEKAGLLVEIKMLATVAEAAATYGIVLTLMNAINAARAKAVNALSR